MSRADELANWLVGNKDKKGTPEWDAKAEEYKRAADAEERKVSPAVQGERDTERLKILATEYFKEMQRFKQGAKDALDNLKSLGREITAAGGQAPALPEAQEAAAAPEETDEQREARMDRERMAYEERMGQLIGGGAGTALTAGRLGAAGAKTALRSAGQAVSQGVAAGAGPVGGPAGPVGGPAGVAPPAAPPGAPGAPSIMRQPSPMAPPAGGPGAFNYGKAFGLTDIEAGRALDMSKQPGGASDLIAQRRQAMQRVEQMFPGQFAENPRYGGLMTPDQSVGRGPRASFTAAPGAPLRQLPPTQPIPTTPRVPSGLEQVTEMFKDMAGKGLRAGVGTALKYGAPPLALAQAGGELARGLEEARKEAPDYAEMALSGLGTLGGALSAFPATAPVGIPISLGVPAYRAVREKVAAEPPVAPMTPEEEIMYRRPSFRISAPKSRGLQ